MENQEQQGNPDLSSPVCDPHNQMRMDVKTSSWSIPQLKEMDTSGEEHAPRVRKPYTITKQRERWTEEDHKKFVEALQLYGRAWRRIEEHIGTKTAIQIRSHAQKFFSKVARESGSNDSQGTLKAIEIPPPRPKRKPIHPYPRKLGNLSNMGDPSLKQLERPPLKIPPACEQEGRSPTSVLSAVGSETLASVFLDGQNGCWSPVASAAGSNDQDDGGQSPNMTIEVDNKLPSYFLAVPRLTVQDQPPIFVEIDRSPDVHTSCKAQVPTLKLFGKMVVVTDSNNSSAPSTGNLAQPNLTSSVNNEGQQENKGFDLHSKAEVCLQNSIHGVSPGDFTRSPGNAYPGPIRPSFYCFPSTGENSTEPSFTPPPWWATYGNLPFPFVHRQPQYPPQFSMEAAGDQETEGKFLD